MGNTCPTCTNLVFSSTKCSNCKKDFHSGCIHLIHKIDNRVKNNVREYYATNVHEVIDLNCDKMYEINHDMKTNRMNYQYMCKECYDTSYLQIYNNWWIKNDNLKALERISTSRRKSINRQTSLTPIITDFM